MTGWRTIHWCSKLIAKACTKMQGQITSQQLIAQRAAIAALDASVDKIQYMVDEFKSRRTLIIDLIKKSMVFH